MANLNLKNYTSMKKIIVHHIDCNHIFKMILWQI